MSLAFMELVVLQWFAGPDTVRYLPPSPPLGLFSETNLEPFAAALLHSLRYGRGRDLEEDLAH